MKKNAKKNDGCGPAPVRRSSLSMDYLETLSNDNVNRSNRPSSPLDLADVNPGNLQFPNLDSVMFFARMGW